MHPPAGPFDRGTESRLQRSRPCTWAWSVGEARAGPGLCPRLSDETTPLASSDLSESVRRVSDQRHRSAPGRGRIPLARGPAAPARPRGAKILRCTPAPDRGGIVLRPARRIMPIPPLTDQDPDPETPRSRPTSAEDAAGPIASLPGRPGSSRAEPPRGRARLDPGLQEWCPCRGTGPLSPATPMDAVTALSPNLTGTPSTKDKRVSSCALSGQGPVRSERKPRGASLLRALG